MVESMAASPLLQPMPGSRVTGTRKDFCGGGSVAPYVEREFAGETAGVEAAYRVLMERDGWSDIRDVPAGGTGATKDDRTVVVTVGAAGWSVSMQQGVQVASCNGDQPGEELTAG